MRPLKAPPYIQNDSTTKVGLAVEDMQRHMTDEGWQIFAGLEHNGYLLAGHNLKYPSTNVKAIVQELNPGTMVIQDKREWDVQQGDFRDPNAKFYNYEMLRKHNEIFKLTIVKDSHQRPRYHMLSAEEMGVHAWITYYRTDVVCRNAPYIRKEHVLRTYHSIDSSKVPEYSPTGRKGCLLSGAVSSVYPLRSKLLKHIDYLKNTDVKQHPGYHNQGCCTPAFLQLLSGYKVAICTASTYQYALRKIIEATACGCRVITNLEEELPHIDKNLVRISLNTSIERINELIQHEINNYDPEFQYDQATRAIERYEYRTQTRILAHQIEALRLNYASVEPQSVLAGKDDE